jgi:hypothetical protein
LQYVTPSTFLLELQVCTRQEHAALKDTTQLELQVCTLQKHAALQNTTQLKDNVALNYSLTVKLGKMIYEIAMPYFRPHHTTACKPNPARICN